MKINILVLAGLIAIGYGCSEKKKTEPDETKLTLMKNGICNAGVICARAEFRLSHTMQENKELQKRMDAEIKNCFSMTVHQDTIIPLAVEAVQDGMIDQVVYVLYFEDNKGLDKKIIYKDRFFGWPVREFKIERN
jgi:hypothetical protein